MMQPIQIAVIPPLLFSVALGRSGNFHTGSGSIVNAGISIMAPAGQRRPRGYSSIRRTVSLLSILYPLWNKHSDRHAICIHGKVKLVSSSLLSGSCPDCSPWILLRVELLPRVDVPYSGRHTICIHGKVKLGVELPFVRLVS